MSFSLGGVEMRKPLLTCLSLTSSVFAGCLRLFPSYVTFCRTKDGSGRRLVGSSNAEEPPATATAPWLAARLLRLVFLSSSLRHHLEDKILGTSTGAARLASGHNADGYVLDDSDSKENQLSKAVSRKSALTPNARSTRSAPRVGADGRARGGRDLASLTVVALKERCAQAGLKKTGRKADLIARLRAHAEAADGEQR